VCACRSSRKLRHLTGVGWSAVPAGTTCAAPDVIADGRERAHCGVPKFGARPEKSPICRNLGHSVPCGHDAPVAQSSDAFPRPRARDGFPMGERVPAHRLPTLIHRVRVGCWLEGIRPLVHSRYTVPPRLPRPRDPVVLARRVRRQGCSRPHPQLRAQAALSFTKRLRPPSIGVSHPARSNSASWRTSQPRNASPAISSS
jgi:hypothetical protein